MNDDGADPPPSGGVGIIATRRDNDDDDDLGGGGGRRLLASSYRSYSPRELGDRYVSFLLGNERTSSALQGRVTMDHLAVIRRLRGGGGLVGAGVEGGDDAIATVVAVDDGDEDEIRGRGGGRAGSIEIDAFQLLSRDPVLGNMTLRYPDTLLELLEDSTVTARRILRGRMEAALRASLDDDCGARSPPVVPHRDDMVRLHAALRRTGDRYSPRPLRARLVRLPPHSGSCKATLSSISASDVGTVVQVCGICVRAGPVRMMETSRTYACAGRGGCGATFSVSADFGTSNNALPTPIVCPNTSEDGGGGDGRRCHSTSFALVPGGSTHADYQEIKVQESASALTRIGSVPRSMLIKLGDDLVDMCNPGDEVVVVGSLHALWLGQNSAGVDGVEAMVGMCMKAHSVRVINVEEGFGGRGGGGGGGASGMAGLTLAGMSGSGNLREKFRREFDAFWSMETSRRRPFATRDYIARSICPKLYGMHAVKLGLLLVLIGGASISSSSSSSSERDGASVEEEDGKQDTAEGGSDAMDAPVAFEIDNVYDDDNDGARAPHRKGKGARDGKSRTSKSAEKAVKRRIQSHILLIGDPGTGKSQFLRFAAALSPRSVLTTGTGSSTAGLTCAAVRGDGNEFSLEAGALALADRGVCCIDEFGCMSKEDRTSIHEAMEQQTISVAKAGIICKLNARATVVAVMNPTCGGIYDESLSLERNSRLGSALLSRFDMIFVMLDQAQCERDVNIAHFLLQQSIIPGSGYDRIHGMDSLSSDDSVNGHWGMEKLRAYIATIREKFHPTLTPEASELIENHYSLCRQQGNDQSLVTVRFLESLIRLSQAHARLMYRDKVLLDDAVAVILLMECTAAASSGGMFGGGVFNHSSDHQFDDCLAKNPIDTEFRPFDEVDAQFEKEKQILLRRYQGRKSNTTKHFNVGSSTCNTSAWDDVGRRDVHSQPSFPCNDQGRDQWGRQMLSQAPSPHPKSNLIRQAIETIEQNQYTPESSHVPGSASGQSLNRVSSQGRLRTVDNQGEMYPNTGRDVSRYCSRGKSGEDMLQVQRDFADSTGRYLGAFGASQEHHSPQSGKYRREEGVMANISQAKLQTHKNDRIQSIAQQFEVFNARPHGNRISPEEPNFNSTAQDSISGTKRKKRRTAD